MAVKTTDYLAEKIVWRTTGDTDYPFTADYEGERCVLRLNDFPDEHLYTLIVDNEEIADFDDWSEEWARD